MYWALLKQGVAEWRHRLWRATVMRSGMLTFLFLLIVLGVLTFLWREHRMGQFAQLKRGLRKAPVRDVEARPGGQDVIQLRRSQMPGGDGPEFISAALLPGRGLNLLQLRAYLPEKGEVNLLVSPELDEAAKLLSGTGADSTGAKSLAMGAAIELPWAGRISGGETPDGKNVITMWRGERLVLPADVKDSYGTGGAVAAGGLLLRQKSDSVNTNVMPDGGEARVTFRPGDFDGRWPSKTEVSTTVELNGRAVDIRIVARNSGDSPEPIGIGWHPRFAILNGHRGEMMLRLPEGQRIEVKDRRTGQLSGRLLPVVGTEYDFTARTGAKLGALNLDDTFVHLKQGLMEHGPEAELRDPENDYGLRITAMTSTIQAIRVYAPLDGSFISIQPQFNFDDPFGREWSKGEDTGMVVLQPGQTTQWKIRLEIFSLSAARRNHL
jgi:aldose 1-epimerase